MGRCGDNITVVERLVCLLSCHKATAVCLFSQIGKCRSSSCHLHPITQTTNAWADVYQGLCLSVRQWLPFGRRIDAGLHTRVTCATDTCPSDRMLPDVSHVAHEVCTHFVCNLPQALVVPFSWVCTASTDDHLGPEIKGLVL